MIQIENTTLNKQTKEKIFNFIEEIKPAMNKVNVQAVTVSGAHAKGTVNKDSDVDLNIYYSFNLKDLLSVNAPSLHFEKANNIEITHGSGTAFFDYEGTEFELNLIPIKTSTNRRKELINNLYVQKVDFLYKLLNSIEIESTEEWKEFYNTLIYDYQLNKQNIFGYFHGYMRSQLQKHKRRLDGKRRLTESLNKNTVTPMVKLTIDGVWICLTGIEMLYNQKIRRDFWSLVIKYENMFELKQLEFIEDCYNHKTDKKRIQVKPSTWVYKAMDMRDEIFITLESEIKKALELSTLPDFTKGMKRKNLNLLNNFVYSLYK